MATASLYNLMAAVVALQAIESTKPGGSWGGGLGAMGCALGAMGAPGQPASNTRCTGHNLFCTLAPVPLTCPAHLSRSPARPTCPAHTSLQPLHTSGAKLFVRWLAATNFLSAVLAVSVSLPLAWLPSYWLAMRGDAASSGAPVPSQLAGAHAMAAVGRGVGAWLGCVSTPRVMRLWQQQSSLVLRNDAACCSNPT